MRCAALVSFTRRGVTVSAPWGVRVGTTGDEVEEDDDQLTGCPNSVTTAFQNSSSLIDLPIFE